jgi:hypothetical protein
MSNTLDYDKMILLDAEDLAEAGILEAYEELLPELQNYVAHLRRLRKRSTTRQADMRSKAE